MEAGPRPMKKALVGFGLVSLSVVLVGLGGARFRQLGSTTIFATLSLCSSVAYSVTHGRRPILGRVTLLLWSVAFLRILGFESTAPTFGVSLFLAIWVALLLVLLTTLHLCLLPIGMGVLAPFRRLFAVRGGLAASGNRDLWYFNRIAFTPLTQCCQVLVVSCVSWGWARQHIIQAGLWVDAVAAISLGLLWPVAILTTKVFSLRPVGGGSSPGPGFAFDGVKAKTGAFAAMTVVVYVCGLVLEFRSTKLYWLWSVCFTFCLVAALCLGRLGSFLSRGSDVTPQQFVDEAEGARRSPQEFVLAWVMILLFGICYLWLMLLTFRPSFFAGVT